jgi:hippurate hydrolase
MHIRNSIAVLKDEIAGYRRAMHEHPQTAYEETFASGLVQDKLKAWGIPFQAGLGKTGVVATLTGQKNTSGRAIGLRADMDALNIIEEGNKLWISKIPGKMHGCGHDGHTAMLLGAAKYLKDNPHFDGMVHLIFQPAEEGGKGAHAMIADGLFKKFPCDRIFGLHNWPQLPKGTVAMRTGPIMASSDVFRMSILGKGGHAAQPHNTIDPIVIGAQIITALQTLISRTTKPTDPAVLSITNFNAGTGAHNVIPDTAHLVGTLRTYDQNLRKTLSEKIGTMARGIAASMGADIKYEYDFVLDPTINEAQSTAFCADIARGLVGDANVDTDVAPSMGGEDFGAMLLEVPGCYIWMGQGEKADPASAHNFGLHTPRYDFNDDIIPLGIEYWARIVEQSLPLNK